MSNKLSIEILHDRLTPDLNIDQIINGIGITADIAGEFEIVDSNRPTILTKTESDIITTKDVLHTPPKADINIIATGRPIEKHGDKKTAGFTSVVPGRQPLGGRMAVISILKGARVDDVTSHELSHALNMKFRGEHYDGNAHCTHENCVMFPSINSGAEAVVVDPLSRFERFKQNIGLNVRTPKLERPMKFHCEECAYQLASCAFTLIQHKSGVFYPDSVIYPSYTKFKLGGNYNA